ncbi:hypothetical protein [Ornithinimicrobium sediminis]|uniref:hypothetical protein n=1 Tax=Ornithinimicrobium sediminis TaxID=2904603 RepID=UPI001E3990FE|nr:hypothetical protein [Ornithinimicrobium sediminis]MCE0486371.1 hypothetical protein [Ornithinimicrobium sediminis]
MERENLWVKLSTYSGTKALADFVLELEGDGDEVRSHTAPERQRIDEVLTQIHQHMETGSTLGEAIGKVQRHGLPLDFRVLLQQALGVEAEIRGLDSEIMLDEQGEANQ